MTLADRFRHRIDRIRQGDSSHDDRGSIMMALLLTMVGTALCTRVLSAIFQV